MNGIKLYIQSCSFFFLSMEVASFQCSVKTTPAWGCFLATGMDYTTVY